ncbi:MAG: sigma-54-dependent transcriptional regulator [Planctomycetota bacterium]
MSTKTGSDEIRSVLVVDDEAGVCEVLSYILEREGYRVAAVSSADEALALYDESPFDVTITDLRMPGRDGISLLRDIKSRNANALVIVITAFSTWDSAVEAMRLGAFDYIRKPFDNEDIRAITARAVEVASELKKRGPSDVPAYVRNIVGASQQMQEIHNLIRRVASTDSTILIQGESGTGKELVARAIYNCSSRSEEAFIVVNCGAFTESLLESELFGHLKGAFTGAISHKKGLLEVAHRGTFFLDEVAEMSRQTQVKFLRVLEEREFMPVGSTEQRRVDVRFITATNRDLEGEVGKGNFREDLFYRLNVIPIVIPPLRERKEDIPLLAGHFLARYSRQMDKNRTGFSTEAMEFLTAYDWPGNVRELENTVHRAVALGSDSEISSADLVIKMRTGTPAAQLIASQMPAEGIDLQRRLEEAERNYIAQALERTGGNVTKAARLLNTSFRSLRYRISKLGI